MGVSGCIPGKACTDQIYHVIPGRLGAFYLVLSPVLSATLPEGVVSQLSVGGLAHLRTCPPSHFLVQAASSSCSSGAGCLLSSLSNRCLAFVFSLQMSLFTPTPGSVFGLLLPRQPGLASSIASFFCPFDTRCLVLFPLRLVIIVIINFVFHFLKALLGIKVGKWRGVQGRTRIG
ncbi:hypothetical protein KQX54_004183 [Cotesia glomerata]|uniref:Transmembrane protein n=1 Tax=Cotesia glomerata TaxID=32391 RepID=A0AAV7I9K5_COTGL|nr:hypothetical protein KQX54_004183 [Cotesia glomerata]